MHFCSPSFRLSKALKRSAIPASGNSEKHVALQKISLFYLDDVIIYSRSLSENLMHVDQVLSLLSHAGILLKLKKCHVFQPCVNYLGHVVTPGKLAVPEKNIETIRQAKHPQNRTDLRSFLGMCTVYRNVVPHFAKKAAPLVLSKSCQVVSENHLL
jgi:Reverse transcriptase (RNA-dependent DNA polymerase)